METGDRRAATRRVFLKLCGSVLGAGIAAPIDARLIEPYAIEVTRHDVYLPTLPPTLDGITVAHLTDLHRGPITPDSVLEHAVRITQALAPDLIALTGDFVHRDPADADPLARMLAPLRARYGIWACLGNHDYADGPHTVARSLIVGTEGRIRFLRNTNADVVRGLYIAGIEDTIYGVPDARAAWQGIPDNAATLYLTHNPTGIHGVAGRSCIALSGHTHGGQILVPGLPIPMPPDMENFPYAAGWGTFGAAHLYISRGVGMGLAPIRFRCRPEIALHVLRRGDSPPRTMPGFSERALRRTARAARAIARRLT